MTGSTRDGPRRRAQANLVALAVALLVVTAVAALSLTIADGAFASADRAAGDRATAETVAERLVSAGSTGTARRNVVTESRLDADAIGTVVPPDVAVVVAVDGETVFERGDATDGQTVRRIALVADRQAVSLEPPLAFDTVTLPRRSPRATVRVDGAADVETVRANDRIVLHDPAGIEGTFDVDISRYDTTTLRFDGDPDPGDVTVTYYPRQTRKVLLEVTVDG